MQSHLAARSQMTVKDGGVSRRGGAHHPPPFTFHPTAQQLYVGAGAQLRWDSKHLRQIHRPACGLLDYQSRGISDLQGVWDFLTGLIDEKLNPQIK